MRIILNLLLFFLCWATAGYSKDNINKKEHYILGGGGEPTGDTTIFDDDMLALGKFSQSSNWKTTLSFNGGHKETEKIIRENFSHSKAIGDFTEDNYNEIIDEMINKIKSGQLKSGDQLMVTINSRGGKNQGEKTHSIALSKSAAKDLKFLKNSRAVNLDKLEILASLASENNVKLALIDLSCFSGNLLNIKNDKICLISSTGPEQYSYGQTPTSYYLFNKLIATYETTFKGEFLSLFKSGNNLEDIFLKARKVGTQPDYPMISTEEGRYINDFLYELINPYLIFDAKVDNAQIIDFLKSYNNPYDQDKYSDAGLKFKYQ